MKKKLNNSIRVRLFLVLSISIMSIIILLMIINTFIYKPFFLYSKLQNLEDIFEQINTYYNNNMSDDEIKVELEKLAIINGIDILIKTSEDYLIFASNKDFLQKISQLENSPYVDGTILEREQAYTVREVNDRHTGIKFMVLYGRTDNGYHTVIRLTISSIEESAKFSNNFLYITGTCVIILSGVIIIIISTRFTKPILELEEIAKKVANLDFSQKYEHKSTEDEIDELGESINRMSIELEKTINQLKNKNVGLEKEIEEKSKIDEMRKQFISDVSHELKTPIALIQGYAEGLKENVNTDEESKNYYVDVILDETNKMDTLVKRLLELMKLEYKAIELNNIDFDITELIKETIRKSNVILEEKNIKMKFECNEKIIVKADEFYIEKVIINYLTNAMKHAKEVKNEKYIEIKVKEIDNKVRVEVFNTGDRISEENLSKIWNRFYKSDMSRNRDDGSTGIGLAFVKAIMNNYNNEYGVVNLENGVNFFFDLDK